MSLLTREIARKERMHDVCIPGRVLAVTYAFPDPHVISNLDGTALNWCRQENLRAQMSETVHFGKVKDPELVVCNIREQLQCRMRGNSESPIEVCPKFWNLNPVTRNMWEVLRIPTWTSSFEFTKKELETILERDVLLAAVPEFPKVRLKTLEMKSP